MPSLQVFTQLSQEKGTASEFSVTIHMWKIIHSITFSATYAHTKDFTENSLLGTYQNSLVKLGLLGVPLCWTQIMCLKW